MWYIGRGVKQLVDPMPAVRPYDTAFLRLGVLLDDVAGVSERHAGFDDLDGGGETLPCGFDDADGVPVGDRFGADVVCFVEVAVEAAVVEGDVEVDDVAVEEEAVVGDAVADDFVGGGADGFGEAVVVEGGGI